MNTTLQKTPFVTIQKLFLEHFENNLQDKDLFLVEATKEELWETYLNSFPEENGIRQSFNCNACRQFIKACGGLVAMNSDYSVTSIWDFEVSDPLYQTIFNNLKRFVYSRPINRVGVFTKENTGISSNLQTLEDGSVIRHYHFYLPNLPVVRPTQTGPLNNTYNTSQGTIAALFHQCTQEALETVVELFKQGSLDKIDFLPKVESALAHYKKYKELEEENLQCNYIWKLSLDRNPVHLFKNSAIGNLVLNLSKGEKTLESCIAIYHDMVDPHNYRRTSAPITPRMISTAEEKLRKRGLINSLSRRFAVTPDIHINNLLYAGQEVPVLGNSVFDVMRQESATSKKPNLSNIEKVSWEKFVSDILPTCNKVSAFLERKFENRLVSLIAPSDLDSPSLFPWDNGFSWAYKGDVASSIKARVKKEGGDVDGFIRISLGWHNRDDLDLHLIPPKPHGRICFASKTNRELEGKLDVDMNAGATINSVDPVENITFKDSSALVSGNYEVHVHNYTKHSHQNVGFSLEFECKQQNLLQVFSCKKGVKEKQRVKVLTFSVKDGQIVKVTPFLSKEEELSTELWGLKTGQFHEVEVLCNSPNTWGEKAVGTPHAFFFLRNCQNDEPTVRGFFNEFLKPELHPHRKVFEVMGTKLLVPNETPDSQLSGIGFSLGGSDHPELLLRVEGNFQRDIIVQF